MVFAHAGVQHRHCYVAAQIRKAWYETWRRAAQPLQRERRGYCGGVPDPFQSTAEGQRRDWPSPNRQQTLTEVGGRLEVCVLGELRGVSAGSPVVTWAASSQNSNIRQLSCHMGLLRCN